MKKFTLICLLISNIGFAASLSEDFSSLVKLLETSNAQNIKIEKKTVDREFSYQDVSDSFSKSFTKDNPTCSGKVSASVMYLYQMANDISSLEAEPLLEKIYRKDMIVGIVFNYFDPVDPCDTRRYSVYFADGAVLSFDIQL